MIPESVGEIIPEWLGDMDRNQQTWLHELGLTRLQPRPVHPKKDPEAEATFKKTLPLS